MIKEDFEGLLYTSDWREPMAMCQERNNAELKIRCITGPPNGSVDYKKLNVLDILTNNKYQLEGWILNSISIPLNWYGTGMTTVSLIDPKGESVFLTLDICHKDVTYRPRGTDFGITVGYRVYETLSLMEEISKYSCKEELKDNGYNLK